MNEPAARPGRTRAAVVGLASSYASVLLSVISGLVLVPLALRSVDPATYGAWLATGNVLAWLTFVDPGTQAVLRQRVGDAYGKRDAAMLEVSIGTGLLINALFCAAFVALGIAAAHGAASWANAPAGTMPVVARAFLLAAVAEGVTMLALGFGSVTVALLWYPAVRGVLFAVATLGGLFASVILFLRGVGLLALPLGLLARAILLLAFEAGLCAVIVRTRLKLVPRASRDELRRLLSLSGATWLARLGGTVLRNLDTIVVARFAGPTAVTSMTVTRRAMDVVTQLTSRVGSAVAPGVAHLAGEGDAANLRRVSLRLFRVASAIGALGAGGVIALDRAFVSLWVSPSLFAGQAVALAFAIWGLWQGLQSILSDTSFAAGAIRESSLLLLAESLLGAALLVGAAALGLGALAPPLGGVLAALPLCALWLKLFSRRTALGAPELAPALRELVLYLALAIAAGVVFARFAPLPAHWPAFVGEAILFGALLSAVFLSISSGLRGELLAALGAVRRRWS